MGMSPAILSSAWGDQRHTIDVISLSSLADARISAIMAMISRRYTLVDGIRAARRDQF